MTVALEWGCKVMLMQLGCTVSGPMPCADSVPRMAWSEQRAAEYELPVVMLGSSLRLCTGSEACGCEMVWARIDVESARQTQSAMRSASE